MALNWIALVLETLGFSLAALETFRPNYAARLEHSINSMVNRERILRLTLSAVAYSVLGVVLAAAFWVVTDYTESDALGLVAFIAAAGLVGTFIERIGSRIGFDPDDVHIFSVLLFCAYLPISLFVAASKKIHPSDRVIGGAGLLIALCGIVLDATQLI